MPGIKPSIKLEDFKANIKDVARPNRFRVDIFIDPRLWRFLDDASLLTSLDGAVVSFNVFKIPYYAKAANLPSRTINAIEYKRYGTTAKYIGDPTIDDIEITFLNDYPLSARRMIDGWMEQCCSQIGNRRHISKLTTQSKMVVWQLGRDRVPLRGYQFEDIWPKTVSQTDLNTETSDQASEFTVTFAYSYWRVLPNLLNSIKNIL